MKHNDSRWILRSYSGAAPHYLRQDPRTGFFSFDPEEHGASIFDFKTAMERATSSNYLTAVLVNFNGD